MTKQLQQIVDRLLSEANFGVLYSACTDEMGIGRIIHDMKEEAEYRFMRGRKRPDVRPETLARWARELSEAFALMEKNVTEYYAVCRRKRDIALIEYPLLAVKIGDGLRRRGIPYLFETQLTTNVLTVRVVNEYFLNIPVTLESVDRVIGLVPYCIHRPDLANEEIPGAWRFRDYNLSRSWNEKTSFGSMQPGIPPSAAGELFPVDQDMTD